MEKDKLKKLAIEAFNKTWSYIDKPNKTNEENEEMIKSAHTSRHYWQKAGGTDLNIVRGDWMISHVYSLIGDGNNALEYAHKCADKTIEIGYDDFDLVFAYEALAFAYKILGDNEQKDYYLMLGYSSIDQVNKQSDKDYCKSQLDLI